MSRVWTPDQEEWLREMYPSEHMPRLLDLFEERFGRRPTAQSMFQKAFKLGLASQATKAPDRAVRPVVWKREPEKNGWMLANDAGQSTALLSSEFAEEFGFPLSRGQINLWRQANGRCVRRSHGGGRPLAPIGAETPCKRGIKVKVAMRPKVPGSKDNWVFKHVLAYEDAYGPVPDGCNVVAANGDIRDCRPENLVAVPRRLMARINSSDTPEWHDRETLEACVAYCMLNEAIYTAETAMPRTCGVCGRTFTPSPSYRASKGQRGIQTCPDCSAKGRKAPGKRKVVEMKRCAVCGRTYGATRPGQMRCVDCIAAKPKWSWRQQLAQIERQGGGGHGEGNG